jgi:hypothetical protein
MASIFLDMENIFEHNIFGIDYGICFHRYVRYLGIRCFGNRLRDLFSQYIKYLRIRYMFLEQVMVRIFLDT